MPFALKFSHELRPPGRLFLLVLSQPATTSGTRRGKFGKRLYIRAPTVYFMRLLPPSAPNQPLNSHCSALLL